MIIITVYVTGIALWATRHRCNHFHHKSKWLWPVPGIDSSLRPSSVFLLLLFMLLLLWSATFFLLFMTAVLQSDLLATQRHSSIPNLSNKSRPLHSGAHSLAETQGLNQLQPTQNAAGKTNEELTLFLFQGFQSVVWVFWDFTTWGI